MREWMRKNGYLPGPVSVDASDWYYSERFLKLPAGDAEKAATFKRLYLAHLLDRANYYESLARQALGRSPQHILLLHTNAVNAALLPDVIEMFRSKGWKTVDAAQAFSDPLYSKWPQTVPAGESIVWLLPKSQEYKVCGTRARMTFTRNRFWTQRACDSRNLERPRRQQRPQPKGRTETLATVSYGSVR